MFRLLPALLVCIKILYLRTSQKASSLHFVYRHFVMSMRRTPRVSQEDGHWSYGPTVIAPHSSGAMGPAAPPSYAASTLNLAYISSNQGYGEEESWALLYENVAYVEKISGDNWHDYIVFIESPITGANNKLVQRVLDRFYPGWGSDNIPATTAMAAMLRRLHYTLPMRMK